jgi:hypothetical protein
MNKIINQRYQSKTKLFLCALNYMGRNDGPFVQTSPVRRFSSPGVQPNPPTHGEIDGVRGRHRATGARLACRFPLRRERASCLLLLRPGSRSASSSTYSLSSALPLLLLLT